MTNTFYAFLLGLVHPFRHVSRSRRKARMYIIPVTIFAFVLALFPDILKYIVINGNVSLNYYFTEAFKAFIYGNLIIN